MAADADSTLWEDMYIVQTVPWREIVLDEQRALREPAEEESYQENHCSVRLPGIEIRQCRHRSGEGRQRR